jgi:hypothetical protein
VPPSINLIIRSAMTPFASAANFINGVNCRRLIVPRLKSNSYSAGGLHWYLPLAPLSLIHFGCVPQCKMPGRGTLTTALYQTGRPTDMWQAKAGNLTVS